MIKQRLRQLTPADIVLLCLLLLTTVGIYYFQRQTAPHKTVYIYLHDSLFGTYDLDKNQTIKVGEHNVVEIKGGCVRMVDANCPDKRCVKQGASSAIPIICLPNQVVVEVKSDNEKSNIHILH